MQREILVRINFEDFIVGWTLKQKYKFDEPSKLLTSELSYLLSIEKCGANKSW